MSHTAAVVNAKFWARNANNKFPYNGFIELVCRHATYIAVVWPQEFIVLRFY
jgi:hypothetical protein